MNINLSMKMLATCFFAASTVFAGNGKKDSKSKAYIDKSNMDMSVKPGDNFYLFVNGNWIKNNPVPAIKTRWGSFDVLREESSQRLRSILQEAAANTGKDRKTQMIGDFYTSGMDSLSIQKTGMAPIKADLDRIAGLQNIQSVLTEVAQL